MEGEKECVEEAGFEGEKVKKKTKKGQRTCRETRKVRDLEVDGH